MRSAGPSLVYYQVRLVFYFLPYLYIYIFYQVGNKRNPRRNGGSATAKQEAFKQKEQIPMTPESPDDRIFRTTPIYVGSHDATAPMS